MRGVCRFVCNTHTLNPSYIALYAEGNFYNCGLRAEESIACETNFNDWFFCVKVITNKPVASS